MRQSLPFRNKILLDKELDSKGVTDRLYRFSDRKKLGGWVVRQLNMTEGDGYDQGLNEESLALQRECLSKFNSASEWHGISVVKYATVKAKLDPKSPAEYWHLANRHEGTSIHEMLTKPSDDPEDLLRAFMGYDRILQAAGDYYLRAALMEDPFVVTDLLKPSQYMLASNDTMTMVDTNQPIYSIGLGLDAAAWQMMMNSYALAVITGVEEPSLRVIDQLQIIDEITPIPQAKTIIYGIHGAHDPERFAQLAIANFLEQPFRS